MTKRLLMLALVVAVAVSGAVLFAETPARACACYDTCSMQVPTGSGYVWISTSCVGETCTCPYVGQGLPVVNGCPN